MSSSKSYGTWIFCKTWRNTKFDFNLASTFCNAFNTSCTREMNRDVVSTWMVVLCVPVWDWNWVASALPVPDSFQFLICSLASVSLVTKSCTTIFATASAEGGMILKYRVITVDIHFDDRCGLRMRRSFFLWKHGIMYTLWCRPLGDWRILVWLDHAVVPLSRLRRNKRNQEEGRQ